MAYERDEGARSVIFVLDSAFGLDDADEVLRVASLAHRDDKTPAFLQLSDQRFGHIRATGCDQNSIVRRVRAPAQRAVETFYSRVVDSKATYARLRLTS